MKKRLDHMWRLINRNLKTLLVFEVLYRMLGLFVILPLARQLMFLSIRVYGREYIINTDLIDYVLSPPTVIIYLFMALVFGMYLTFEIVVLSVLFHASENNQDVGLKPLFAAGLRKTKQMLRQYHVVMILSVFIFFFTIELVHVAGIASTFRIPSVVLAFMDDIPFLRMMIVLSLTGLFLMFGMTVFLEIEGFHHVQSIKAAFKRNIMLIRKGSWRVYVEFLLLNAILNIIIYGVSMAIVGLAAWVISVFYSSSAVFGILLTIVYTVFVIVGFLSTIVLMPINYAWINSLYFDRGGHHERTSDRVIPVFDKTRPFVNKRMVRRLAVVGLVAVFALNVFTVVDLVQNPTPAIQAFQRPRIIAHRGSSASAPENTISAIEQAIRDGADAVEIDVRFTRDDVPVLMHDETVERTTDIAEGSSSSVRALTLEEIKALDAGSWFNDQYAGETVPTLAEALQTARGHVDVYIEVKSGIRGASVILTDIIAETGMENRVKILSFNGMFLEDVKREAPSIEIVQLIGTFFGNINVLADDDMVDHYGFGNHILVNNEDYVRAMKQQGKGIYVYTVNDDEDIRYTNRIGVDGIITDEPERAREVVYSAATNDVFDKIMASLFQR